MGAQPGRDESLPYGLNRKSDLAATTAGGGIPNAPRKNHERDLAADFGGVEAPRPTQIFKWGCRAASPLAAVPICGSEKLCGLCL